MKAQTSLRFRQLLVLALGVATLISAPQTSAEPADHDYDIQMQPIHAGLEPIRIADDKRLSDHPWFNRTLAAVNDSLVRLGVFEGEFHWHAHETEDEFFLVLDGALTIELEGRDPVVLGPQEGLLVPKGVRHRPVAKTGARVLMIENRSIVPTGDAG